MTGIYNKITVIVSETEVRGKWVHVNRETEAAPTIIAKLRHLSARPTAVQSQYTRAQLPRDHLYLPVLLIR